jgi:hypothetical protein
LDLVEVQVLVKEMLSKNPNCRPTMRKILQCDCFAPVIKELIVQYALIGFTEIQKEIKLVLDQSQTGSCDSNIEQVFYS